jgi:thiosulfate dehydrogenase [quinone] large subunit
MPLGMPPRGWLLAGWALLPVRAFLAVVFIFAGLQKLANPAFFDPASGFSMHAQMIGAIRISPIHVLLGHLLRFSTPLGILIIIAEVAIGLGIGLGLWTRIAAIGGMVLALNLFLTVSWRDYPWFTSPDLVYFFALTPFVIAGAGGVLSLDALIARRSTSERELADPRVAVIPFAQVQDACGYYEHGRCTAVSGRTCAPAGCPYLEGERASLPGGRRPDEVDRRAVVLGGIAAAAAATVGAVAAGAAAGAGRLLGGTPPSSKQGSLPTGSTGPPSATGGSGGKGTLIGPAADVPVGQSATFTVPGTGGEPGLVVQSSAGQFVAYNAICPHAGCTVAYQPANGLIACPCHGSEFEVSNGDVIVGPATVGLTALTIKDEGGQLYVQ